MVDWRALVSTLVMPAATAFGVWLVALSVVSAAAVESHGGPAAILLLMLEFGYILSAILLAVEGVIHTVEARRRGRRSEWSLFPNRYDRSAVAVAVALAINL